MTFSVPAYKFSGCTKLKAQNCAKFRCVLKSIVSRYWEIGFGA